MVRVCGLRTYLYIVLFKQIIDKFTYSIMLIHTDLSLVLHYVKA